MNFSVLLRALGKLVLLLGMAMVMALALAALAPSGEGHDTGLYLRGWAVSVTIAFGFGFVLWAAGRFIGKRTGRLGTMRRREAMALVGCGWLVGGATAALPYLLCVPGLPPEDAIFEAVSGLTTTGSSIFSDIEALPKSILMWRSVTQWLGGMGILAMFVVVLQGMTSSSKTLIGAESSMANTDIASLRQTMRHIWLLYIFLTISCIAGLHFCNLSSFQAVNHGMTAVSTGGFGTENDSVGIAFNDASRIWLTIFMILGGISFPFYLTILRKGFRGHGKRFEEVAWFLGLLLICSTILIIQHYAGWLDVSPVDIIFNIASVSTTTGFVSSDFDLWTREGVAILLILFMIGGCSGSTSGGLKVSRAVLWFRFAISALSRSFRPQAIKPIKLHGKQVQAETIEQLFLVLSLFAFFLIAGTMAFHSLNPGYSIMGGFSAVLSCLGNIGPALAEMGPTENFGSISTGNKLLCASLMILGRLEYVSVLVIFIPALWRRY